MLAKRRTESEMSRMKFESSSSTKMKPAMAPVTPAGIRLLR